MALHLTKKKTKTKTMTKTHTLRAPSKSYPSDLWHLRHWLHFWQLRTWFLDNLCYLTIRSDTGQHLQFLRCLILLFSAAEDMIRLKFLFFFAFLGSAQGRNNTTTNVGNGMLEDLRNDTLMELIDLLKGQVGKNSLSKGL